DPQAEITTIQLPAPVCDGYVVLTEFDTPTPQRSAFWSDVAVFWNGATTPSGACDARFLTLISDSPLAAFPAGGPMFPNGGPPTLPPPLGGLTIEQINAAINFSGIVYTPEIATPTGDGTVYQAAPSNTYTIQSDLPPIVPDPGSTPGNPGGGFTF